MDKKCLLCQNQEADKTGSHIIPSFFMKRINGDGKRDHEVGFEIKGSIVDSYFGRDIYEDQRRTFTDQEEKIESRENYDVRDFIFCADCEKCFSKLESAYAQSLLLNYNDGKNTINNKVTPLEALLFWCSLVWRASVTEHLGQRLQPPYEERLRLALANNSIENLGVKYALFRCKDYGKEPGKGTALCMDVKDNTVLMIVDDYMLAMVFDVDDNQHDAFLMDIGLELVPNKLNDRIRPEEIAPLPVNYFGLIMRSIIGTTVKSMALPDKFSDMHNALFGSFLPDDIIDDILELVQTHDCKLGDRYTIEHYAWCYKEILKRRGLIIENGDGTLTLLRVKKCERSHIWMRARKQR